MATWYNEANADHNRAVVEEVVVVEEVEEEVKEIKMS